MNLQDLLSRHKETILKRWFKKILETYPSDTSAFLKREKDPFANPVGGTISKGIEGLYEALIEGADPADASSFLDQIIRIRAIQDFSPSEAIGFVFFLKKAVKDELGKEVLDDRISSDMSALESRIDDLALLSFDIYMECREKLYELKTNDVRNRAFVLLEKTGYVSRISEPEENPENDNNGSST